MTGVRNCRATRPCILYSAFYFKPFTTYASDMD
jgi:hypothetical protein